MEDFILTEYNEQLSQILYAQSFFTGSIGVLEPELTELTTAPESTIGSMASSAAVGPTPLPQGEGFGSTPEPLTGPGTY